MAVTSVAVETAGRERERMRLVALVFIVYLLVILEGGLRKWVFPGFSQYLFFVRDPFVLLAYALAWQGGWWPRQNPLLNVGLGLAATGLIVGLIQSLTAGGGMEGRLLLAGYGWRNYFFYSPFAVLIGQVVRERELRWLFRMTLWMAVPVAVLIFLQFRAAPDAPINIGTGATEALQFRGLGLDADHTRPTGTFTSDVGQKLFDASCIAMLMAAWIAPAGRRFIPNWQLLIVTSATLTALALSGSRGAMVLSGIVVASAIGCSVLLRGAGLSARAILIPSILCIVAVALYPVVFPDGYSTFMDRWTSASAVESESFRFGLLGRALSGFVFFFNIIGDTPLVGYGLGLAGNASLTLGVAIQGFSGWAEDDWSRHIVDLGPIFGVAIIVARIAFTVWLTRRCVTGAIRNRDPVPILLLSFIGTELLFGELTGHGTVNGYGWVFAGLCLAASAPQPLAVYAGGTAGASVAPPARVPRFPHLLR